MAFCFALGAVGASTLARADEPGTRSATVTSSVTAAAAPSVSVPEAEAPPTEPWYNNLVVSGLVDAYYSRGTTRDVLAPNALRTFDVTNGRVTLAFAKLSVGTSPDLPAGLRFDLGFGPVADLTSLEPAPDASGAGPSEILKHVEQVYATFKVPFAPSIRVDIGKFVTSAGAEVIEAKDNFNYSRSLLFGYAIPFTHTGVRVVSALTEAFSLQASVVNGWDVVFDNNKQKTLNLSTVYASGDWVAVALNLYAGAERSVGSGWRYLADAVVTRRLGDKFTVTLNGDFGFESGGAPDGGNARWYGGAGYGRYQVNEYFAMAARIEDFQDPEGARTGEVDGVGILEGTMTLIAPIGGHVEIRGEARHDRATRSIYDSRRSDHQTTFQLAGLAWF